MSINLINLILLFLIVCLSMFLIYKKLIVSSPSSSTIDETIINPAVRAAGINTLKEPFYTNEVIVFDSSEKINNNFEKFIKTYLPSVDINLIKQLFEKDSINKSMDDIIKENNIDATLLISTILDKIILIIYAENNKNNIILFGLLIFIAIKIRMQNNYKYYYLNDYDIQNDFIIYCIPSDYTGDISKLSKDTNIKIESDFFSNEPFKISLNNIVKRIASSYIKRANSIPDDGDVTDEEINTFLSITQKNNVMLNNLIHYYIVIQFIMIYYKGNDTIKNSNIVKLIISALDPISYTADMNKYLQFSKQPVDSIYYTFLSLYRRIKVDQSTSASTN